MLKSKKTPYESAKNSQCEKFPLCCGISRKGYALPGIVESHKNISRWNSTVERSYKWPLDQVLKRLRINERRTVLEVGS